MRGVEGAQRSDCTLQGRGQLKQARLKMAKSGRLQAGERRSATNPIIAGRRALAFFCAIPDDVSGLMATAPRAALTIVGREIMATGHCKLTASEIAERAFVTPSTARAALKLAKDCGLIGVDADGALTTRRFDWIARMHDREEAVAEFEACGSLLKLNS